MIKPDPLVPLWRHARGRRAAWTRAATARRRRLDEAQVRAAVDELVDAGVESLTIALPQLLREPRARAPRARRSRASSIPSCRSRSPPTCVSEYREYERTLTAVLNSYAQPQVIRYVDGLESAAAASVGFDGRLEHRALRRRHDERASPPRSARSTSRSPGPSGGVVGAAYLAARASASPNVLTFDMGGTSTDVVAVPRRRGRRSSARPQLGYYQFQVARSVDVHSVGAGGGSIAYLEPRRRAARRARSQRGRRARARLPTAAAATEPTVTDANVVLGRLPPRLQARRAR